MCFRRSTKEFLGTRFLGTRVGVKGEWEAGAPRENPDQLRLLGNCLPTPPLS